MATLEDRELAQQVKVAEATVAAAEASLGRYQAEKQQASSSLTQADSEYNRLRRLRDANAVSDSELDQAKEAFDPHGPVSLVPARGWSKSAEQIALAGESLKYQQTRLADTRLLAPFDGLVIKRHKDPGAITVPGTAVVDLISMKELWISAWVDETQMGRLEDEQPARVVFRSESETASQAQSPDSAEQSDRETREFVVDVRVLQLPGNWSIGQRAEVFIEVDRSEDSLVIPESYVHVQAGRPAYLSMKRPSLDGVRAACLARSGTSGNPDGLETGERILVSRTSRPAA